MSKQKSGSALLLTLLVVSLLLVIVLSFTVYVRLELRTVSNRIANTQAQQNAKLALNIALAQLQRAAGADQRVTARADILGSSQTVHNRHWTGVWEVNGTGSVNNNPVWLVSGLSPEPTVIENEYEIYPATISEPAVKVALQEIKDNSNQPIGNYAYWVSDEGVKASLSKIDLEKLGGYTADKRGLTDIEMARLPQLTPGRARNERLFSFTGWDTRAEDFEKTASYEQLAFAGLVKTDLTNQRHRATWRSMGVLANSETGGLKQDLSFVGSDASMDDFSITSALQDWVQNRPSGLSIPMIGSTLPAGSTPPTGEPIFTTPLVLTEFALYMRFSRNSSGNGLRFLMTIKPEVWNPNSFPLTVMPPGNPDLVFEIEGLPELSCTWVTGTSSNPQVLATGSFTLDPSGLSLSTDEGNNELFNSLSMAINKTVGYVEAGEVYTTSMKAEGALSQSLTSDSTTTKTDDFMSLKGDASTVTLRVKNTNDEILQEFIDIPFPAFDTTGRQAVNDNLTGSASRNLGEYQIVFHFRLDDETVTLNPYASAPIEHWFSEVDPRSPSISSTEYNTSILTSSPDEAAFEPLFQSQPDLFAFGFRYFPAFDVPVGPPISVGSLQHLQFASTPPYAVGNTWGNQNDVFGNAFNSYFDRYFFSTVPQVISNYDPQSGTPLANTHLIPQELPFNDLNLASLQAPFSSKQFLIDGAFNINCTEPLVWQAILGSLNLTALKYNEDAKNVDVQYGIFHLPFGVDQYLGTYPDNSDTSWFKDGSLPTWSNAFSIGLRELSEANLQALATQITNLIKVEEKPFASIRDLADSGLLQAAIDATNINSPGSGIYSASTFAERIPAFAPAFVSQADLLQLIAPFSLARSDTFIIRAYGNSVSATGMNSEQICEAVVQRTSEPMTFQNATDAQTVSADYINPPDSFGRRFKIISFTWLDELP